MVNVETCGLEFPQEVESVRGFCLVSVDDQSYDEGVDDGNHEELGRDKVVGQFPEKKKINSFLCLLYLDGRL